MRVGQLHPDKKSAFGVEAGRYEGSTCNHALWSNDIQDSREPLGVLIEAA